MKEDISEQKVLFRKLFGDAGWEADGFLKGMDQGDDFYVKKLVQVKTNKWFTDHAVLLGDAALEPSPISGIGTTLAITSAYILAAGIDSNPQDLLQAMKSYEANMRHFVYKGQTLAPGALQIANPQMQLGISFLGGVLRFASWSRLTRVMQNLGSLTPPLKDMDLPEFKF